MQLARLGAIGVTSILQITGSPAGPACSVNVLRGRYRYQIICIHHSNNPYELHELIRRTVDARANKPPKSTPKAVFSNDKTKVVLSGYHVLSLLNTAFGVDLGGLFALASTVLRTNSCNS